jgi:GMP synthase-like glutamine amidotransferase
VTGAVRRSGPPRVGLLLVGHVAPSAVPAFGDYPELFADLLPDVELVRFDLDRDRFPGSVRECDAWLMGPSRDSVTDGLPWIRSAEDLLREMVATETPFVGICFGHQLVASALGAPVARAEAGWEVGVHDYDIVARRPWMEPPARSVALIASHEDQVLAVPDDATLLARTDGCPVAGLLVGDRAWTVQPHPEFTPALAAHLLDRRVELIGAEKVAAARRTLERPLDRRRVASWVTRFVASVTTP